MTRTAIDLFAGVGGLTLGLKKAGFKVVAGIEFDHIAAETYRSNHPSIPLIEADIRSVSTESIKSLLNGKPLSLLAGCPPCQGFSSVRRLNRKKQVRDRRNALILEYLRFVHELKPLTILMENVPGLLEYELFDSCVERLSEIGYAVKYGVVNIEEFGVPQRRKRLVMIGSQLADIDLPAARGRRRTVRETIQKLQDPEKSRDPLHRRVANHTPEVQEIIRRIPRNGGSRKDLPARFTLSCHKRQRVGFSDVYGRMRWDDVAPTITGGCLNPSKGRFLHPEKNRAITAREAALLQSFPASYKFPQAISKDALGLLIGNALPPTFAYVQGRHIERHLTEYSTTTKRGRHGGK